MKEAPKTIVLVLEAEKRPPKPGTIFWSFGEIRNAVIDFEVVNMPCYSVHDVSDALLADEIAKAMRTMEEL